jgi:hypothetical protein
VTENEPERAQARGLAWRWVLSRLLIVIPIIQLYATLTAAIEAPSTSDYWLLYVHAEMARHEETLYWPWPDYGPHFGANGLRFPEDRIFYPPFLTPVLSGVSRFGVETFSRMWVLLLWAAYWVYAACLAKLSHGRVGFLPTIGWGTAIFVLTLRASQSAINLGNVDPLLWAFYGLALAYPAWRGFGFMSSALIKLYGVWPLFFAALDREWRTIRTALLTLLGGIVLASLALGPADFVRESINWFRYMLPVAGQGTFNPYNVSLSFLVLRAARHLGWQYVSGPLGSGARLFLTITGIAAPLLAGFLLRKADKRLRYAGVVCAAVFFAPLAWNFYTPLLFAPAAILLGRRHAVEDPPAATHRWGAASVER